MNTNINEHAKRSKRNSLLELYRFLFALWVVWYHGFFIFKNQYFASGYLAVEFFFMLSGFYFLKALKKYDRHSFVGVLIQMVWSKLKPLGLPLAVGIVFVIWQRLLEGKPVLMGYLWYIPIMLLSFALIYTLRRLIKNDVAFVWSLALLTIACFLILYIPVLEKFGVARGIGSVSFGVLLSIIPKVELKIKNFNINKAITVVLFAVVLYLAFLPKDNLLCEYLLVFLFMPALLYFTDTFNVNSKVLNILGSLSFALYAYQCVVRVIRMIVSLPQYWLFVILIALVVIDRLIKDLSERYRSPQAAN